jgi:hypothetical protein
MPDFNDIIRVNRETEKRIYRIMKELEAKGESIIENVNNDSEWESTLKRIGRRSQPLLENNILDRPLISGFPHQNYKNMRLISLPKNIEVEEEPGNNMSFFHFKRRSLF